MPSPPTKAGAPSFSRSVREGGAFSSHYFPVRTSAVTDEHRWATHALTTHKSGCPVLLAFCARGRGLYLTPRRLLRSLQSHGMAMRLRPGANFRGDGRTPAGPPETQNPCVLRSRKGLEKPRPLAKNARRAGHPFFVGKGWAGLCNNNGNTINDAFTGATLTDSSVGMYVVGETAIANIGNSRFTTSPNNSSTAKAVTWVVGSTPPPANVQCAAGSLYSCTTGSCTTGTLFECTGNGWKFIK
jgi:hypothetical protein